MKFTPRPDYGSFQDTTRKRQCAERRQQQEREAAPLLADLIAEQQPSIDSLMNQRAEDWDRDEERARARLAASWRHIRAAIAALPAPQRQEIKARAQLYAGPLNPISYAYFYRETTGHHPAPAVPEGDFQ